MVHLQFRAGIHSVLNPLDRGLGLLNLIVSLGLAKLHCKLSLHQQRFGILVFGLQSLSLLATQGSQLPRFPDSSTMRVRKAEFSQRMWLLEGTEP